MRFVSVGLSWFRGASDNAVLDLGGKSAVIYGPNGAGKSSFVDVVEYVIEDGRISHLAHEYSGRRQEKAVLNTHIPGDEEASLAIAFDDGTSLTGTVAQNGVHTVDGDGAAQMAGWEYRRTVLRQDEVADFIRSRKGDKYSALLPLFGLHEMEQIAHNVEQLARAIQTRGNLDEKERALREADMKREAHFGDIVLAERVEELHREYCGESDAEGLAEKCKELHEEIATRISEFSVQDKKYQVLLSMAGADLVGAIKSVRDANSELAQVVEPWISEKLAVLQSADDFTSKQDPEDEVECPACGRSVPVQEFRAHVESEQDRLKDVLGVYEKRRLATVNLIDQIKILATAINKEDVAEWREQLAQGVLKECVEWVMAFDVEAFRKSFDEQALTDVESNWQPIIEAAKGATVSAPPDIKDLTDHQTLVGAAQDILAADKLVEKVSAIKSLKEFLDGVAERVRDEIKVRSQAVIDEISGDISAMWGVLHPGEPIEDVRLTVPDGPKAIDVSLKFFGKEQDSPRLTLSEGYRNSLGLCIFLALAKREAGHDRPLVLDDVVVSLDRNHRGLIAELLEGEFADRQVVVFTHDRTWYAELRQQLEASRWRFKTLLPYVNPEVGIRWSEKTAPIEEARAQLEERPDAAGNDARKIMDTELAVIAERLQSRLPYRRGERNDMRMSQEFLERLIKDGKTCFEINSGEKYEPHEEAIAALDEAAKLLVTWGNRGSHSSDLVRPEAEKLIAACEAALDAFRCSECGKTVWFANIANKTVQCQCSHLRWRYDKV